MFRLFNELTSFNTESTATKLLYQIKDRFIKHNTANGHILDTDNIKNMEVLVKTLSEVISSTLDYATYQKCHSYIKERIKLLILDELTYASAAHESEYSVIPVYGDQDEKILQKGSGITMSLRYHPGPGYPYQAYNIAEATCANFPEKLFLDKARLQKHIIRALKYEYPRMLKNISNHLNQRKVS